MSLIPGKPTNSKRSSGLTSSADMSSLLSPYNQGLTKLELLKLCSPSGTTLVISEIRKCDIFMVSDYGVPTATYVKHGNKSLFSIETEVIKQMHQSTV
jgi:hypothetical protein